MSREPTQADLRATSTVLNTLNAEHQGALARENLLRRLGDGAFDPAVLDSLHERLRRIGEWGEQLWRREPLLFTDGSSPRDTELRLALAWLDELGTRLERVGRGLEVALDALTAHEHGLAPAPPTALVAAGLAWVSYSWENELRGALQYGQTLDDPEIAERAGQQWPLAIEGLRLLHHLMDRLESEPSPGCELLGEVHRSGAHLPGVFAAKAEAVALIAAEARSLEG